MDDLNNLSINLEIESTEIETYHTRSIELSIKPILWDEQHACVLLLNDTTDRDMVNALYLADKHKDKLLATVSHEFRTPINGIVGLMNIMEEESKDKHLIPDVVKESQS
mmetsp:Transcript_20955/g.18288  ORF Transcript_20955/g.18288 Transcript_20955/m.18288 type:complete len:109 (+) Transcript_20955:301-627(+)